MLYAYIISHLIGNWTYLKKKKKKKKESSS